MSLAKLIRVFDRVAPVFLISMGLFLAYATATLNV